MPRLNRTIRVTFTGGEIAPELHGRSDLDKHYQSLETEENFISLIYGPAERRPGFRFVAEVKDSSKTVRLKAFQFSTTQTYMLEFGDLYMRVYRNGGQVQSGGSPFELVTPWAEADLPDLQFASKADVLYVAHPNFAPRKITRTADDNWTLNTVNFLPPPSDESQLQPAQTLTLAAQTGFNIAFTTGAAAFLQSDVGREITGSDGGRAVIITFNTTASVQVDIVEDFPSASYTAGNWTIHQSPNTTCTPTAKGPRFAIVTLNLAAAGWRSGVDEGKIVKINQGIVKLTEITSNTAARGQILLAMTTADAALGGEWTLGEEVWTDAKGWPSTIAMHEGRLLLGATATWPARFWGSAAGGNALEDFGEGANDDDAYSFSIAASLQDAIEWMAPAKRLFIGTVGSELSVNDGQNDPISPTNIAIRSEAVNGSIGHQPIRINDSIVHINRHRNKLWELAFNLDRDAFVSTNLLLLASHFAGNCPGDLVDFTYQQEDTPIVWAARTDGVLLGITFKRDEKVVAGHRHILGGNFAGGIPEVEQTEVIPHWTDPYDTLWVVVKRTINGVTRRYIEYSDKDLNTDSGLTGESATPFSTVSGLGHLEGETVRVVEDHNVATNKVVSGGAITLDGSVFTAEVGLDYVSTLKTLPLQMPGADTLTGLVKRLSEIHVDVENIGTITINGHKLTEGTGQAPFTGVLRIENLGHDRLGQVTIKATDPLPMRIREIAAEDNADEDRR